MEKEVLDFLNQLRQNNNREWFAENKVLFETVKDKVHTVFQGIYEQLTTIDEVEPLKKYRIYRDIRFSADKTPYKNHFSMFAGRLKPNYRGGYYLHIEPGNSFIGIGFFGPEKDDLLRIRKEIELDNELQQILESQEIKKAFGKFEGEELKTAPKGFDKNHERIHLIRKKQFLLTHQLSDKEVLDSNFEQKVVEIFHTARPFLDYMTDVLLTNLNGERV